MGDAAIKAKARWFCFLCEDEPLDPLKEICREAMKLKNVMKRYSFQFLLAVLIW
jgi:hypothetical protein